jgi:long-chain acyl-CoA synthetase
MGGGCHALLTAPPVPLNSFGLSSELMANLEDTRPVMLICRTAMLASARPLRRRPSTVVDGEGAISAGRS